MCSLIFIWKVMINEKSVFWKNCFRFCYVCRFVYISSYIFPCILFWSFFNWDESIFVIDFYAEAEVFSICAFCFLQIYFNIFNELFFIFLKSFDNFWLKQINFYDRFRSKSRHNLWLNDKTFFLFIIFVFYFNLFILRCSI